MAAKKRVLLAMSGGIDSSIAAVLLQKSGYDVVGITLKTWDYALTGSTQKETGCCNLDTINDARTVAVKLGIPHYILDIKEEFFDTIVKDFISEYLKGTTPNPCVLCNVLIKWGALLKRADMLNCDYLATGHYGKIRVENNRYVLSTGVDDTKDQSYVLWGLTQESLSRTIFPLGDYLKEDVRKLARELGYDNLAQKKESYEICFIPDDDYRKFLRQQVPDIDEKIGTGNFVNTDGEIIGKHRGFPFYTIGQRKGLEVAMGYPVYVKKIIAETNTIVLGKKEDLEEREMHVDRVNLIKYEDIPEVGIEAFVKVRYKDKGTKAMIYPQENGVYKVVFNKHVSAITPGQSAVFMEGKDVMGGGIIMK